MKVSIITGGHKRIWVIAAVGVALTASIIALAIGLCGKGRSGQTMQTAIEIALPQGSELSLGKTVEVQTEVTPRSAESSITLTASGAVRLMDDGTLKAVDAGRFTVSATDSVSGAAAGISGTVKDDCLERTQAAVKALVDTGADEQSLTELERLAQELTGCGGSADGLLDYINTMKAYAADSEDARRSMQALCDEVGVQFETTRMAVESIAARSQMSEDTILLSLVGDCTIADRNDEDRGNYFPRVFAAQDSPTYPADKVMHWLKADDLTVINHESAISDHPVHAPKAINFRSTPQYAAILKEASVEVACLSNNHAYDYMEQGYKDTISCLDGLGISTSRKDEPCIMNVKGTEVVIISAGAGVSFDRIEVTAESVLRQLEQYKKKDNLVVVELHWGDEYVELPYSYQQVYAKSFIDAGADIIVGHHPHIIQGIEVYKGKLIAYSLGNFMYSGFVFSYDSASMILRVSFGKNDSGEVTMKDWSIVPCFVSGTRTIYNNFQPVTLNGEEAERHIDLLLKRSRFMREGVRSVKYLK